MKIIFVFAHPDDETFSSGGTIAKLAQNGVIVKLITLTKGEKGQLGDPPVATRENVGDVREKELKSAAKILGISQIYFLGYIDGELKNTPTEKIAGDVLKILEEEKPDAVVTFNEEGNSRHPDHIQTNKCVTTAFKAYINVTQKHVKLYYAESKRSLVREFKKLGMSYSVYGEIKGTPDSLITTSVDISDVIDVKIKASKCHLTQKKDWERLIKRLGEKEFQYEFFRLVLENKIV